MSQRRNDFVATVIEQMGVPYVWGSDDPAVGLDCNGLVCHSLWKIGGPTSI